MPDFLSASPGCWTHSLCQQQQHIVIMLTDAERCFELAGIRLYGFEEEQIMYNAHQVPTEPHVWDQMWNYDIAARGCDKYTEAC